MRNLGQLKAAYAGVIALSLATSAAFWNTPGTDDVQAYWLPWLRLVSDFGVVEGYARALGDYPPGTAMLLYLARLIPGPLTDIQAFKLLGAAAQLGAALIFLWRSKNGPLAAVFVMAVALSSSGLKYVDILFAAPLLLSLFSALERRPLLSACSFGAACFIKWQPLILAPFLLIVWLDQMKERPSRTIAAVSLLWAALLVACTVPFWLEAVRALARALDHRSLSAQALNLPWFFQVMSTGSAEVTWQAPVAERIVFKLLFWMVYAAFWIRGLRYRHDPESVLTFSFAGFVAYFMLAPGVHESHFFVPMLVGLVLWSHSSRFALLAVASVLFGNVNLAIFYGYSGEWLFGDQGFILASSALVAGIGVLAFGAFAYRLLRSELGPEPENSGR